MKPKRRILITGASGQLGWELTRALSPLGEIFATTRQELKLEKPDSIRKLIDSFNPQAIINAAAYTQVEKAEDEPTLAYLINGEIPPILAQECKKEGPFFFIILRIMSSMEKRTLLILKQMQPNLSMFTEKAN